MENKAIPTFSTERAYRAWLADFADQAELTQGLIAAHQLGEITRLRPAEAIYIAFPKMVQQGLWKWPPGPLKVIP